MLVFLLFPILLITSGVHSILRQPENGTPPTAAENKQSVQTSQFSPIVGVASSNNPSNTQADTQPQPPSRQLLPPFAIPGVVASSNPEFVSGQPQLPPTNLVSQPEQQQQPQQEQRRGPLVLINGEMLELLPPIEIPPEFPIDGDNNNNGGAGINSPVQGSSQSSSSFSQIHNNRGLVKFNQNIAPTRSPPTNTGNRDPGLDCLGTCDCPSDFNFVCGSNRFLYQNECALICDKKCHPDVIKVSMTHCSRK